MTAPRRQPRRRNPLRDLTCPLCLLAQALEEDFVIGCGRIRRLLEADRTDAADALDTRLDRIHDMAREVGLTHTGEVM